MATILVDYENVGLSDGLKGVEYLNEKDTLIIFYSQCCEKIKAEYIELIEKSQCKFRIYKLVQTGKNALDFYIAVECGYLSAQEENQICIISKDKGFSAVRDFFSVKAEVEEVSVYNVPDIESALLLLNAPEDLERKKWIKDRTKLLNIESEQARINEHMEFVNKILALFAGTDYENKTDSILKFIDDSRIKSPKRLYTSSLHEFGQKDGRAIYKILRQAI